MKGVNNTRELGKSFGRDANANRYYHPHPLYLNYASGVYRGIDAQTSMAPIYVCFAFLRERNDKVGDL